MIQNLTRRLGKIEKELSKDKPVWLRLPRRMLGRDGNPEELVEIVGCRTMTDLIVRADKARKERQYDQEH